ncbi:hypothetical protein [Coleofasciculus sp.]|uniref:hypothetical protein n=1 Tax=Coleofasciculus sp. TaxID=3100458 RepID=UPI0039FA149F
MARSLRLVGNAHPTRLASLKLWVKFFLNRYSHKGLRKYLTTVLTLPMYYTHANLRSHRTSS